MADTLTPNYGWVQPTVGGDASTWGTTINNDLALIDAQVFANEQGVAPVGTIVMFGGAAAPPNWLLCNGASLSTATYAALFAAIGYAFGGSGANFSLPNLQQRFPLGAEATNPLGSLGGSYSYTITLANLPSHAHPIADAGHTHPASQPAHNHPDPGHTHAGSQDPHAHGGVQQTNVGNYYTFTGNPWFGPGQTDVQQPAVHIGAAVAGLQAAQPSISVTAALTGITTTAAVGSGTPMSIVPAYQAVNFIIRYR